MAVKINIYIIAGQKSNQHKTTKKKKEKKGDACLLHIVLCYYGDKIKKRKKMQKIKGKEERK